LLPGLNAPPGGQTPGGLSGFLRLPPQPGPGVGAARRRSSRARTQAQGRADQLSGVAERAGACSAVPAPPAACLRRPGQARLALIRSRQSFPRTWASRTRVRVCNNSLQLLPLQVLEQLVEVVTIAQGVKSGVGLQAFEVGLVPEIAASASQLEQGHRPLG